MKIGIVCYPTYGGSGIIATELASTLALNHDVHVVSYDKPVRSGEESGFNFHVVNTPTYPLFKYPPYTLALTSKLVEIIETYGLDIIHVHYAIPNAISAYLAKKISDCEVKVVTTLHGTDSYLVGSHPSYRITTQFSMRHTDCLTTVSNYLKKTTLEEFDTDLEIEVIPNFVDPEKFKKIDESSDTKTICHSSNFRPVKRIPDTIRALKKISGEIECELLLVGDGPERPKAEELSKNLGISDKVRFFGNVRNIQDILGKSDLFFLPSQEESFGLAALEAMSCEVPVIASRVGGLKELLSHGEDGYLVQKGDVEALARYSLKILNDPKLQRKIGRNGREKVLEKYTPDKIIPKYEKIYRTVLNESG